MITEIEIEDVGTVRPLNVYQIARAKRGKGADGHKRWLAFSTGLTLPQFKKLPADKQDEIRFAYGVMTSAANTAEPGRRSVTVDALVRERRGASTGSLRAAA